MVNLNYAQCSNHAKIAKTDIEIIRDFLMNTIFMGDVARISGKAKNSKIMAEQSPPLTINTILCTFNSSTLTKHN